MEFSSLIVWDEREQKRNFQNVSGPGFVTSQSECTRVTQGFGPGYTMVHIPGLISCCCDLVTGSLTDWLLPCSLLPLSVHNVTTQLPLRHWPQSQASPVTPGPGLRESQQLGHCRPGQPERGARFEFVKIMVIIIK